MFYFPFIFEENRNGSKIAIDNILNKIRLLEKNYPLWKLNLCKKFKIDWDFVANCMVCFI